jgi:hypothetical protein
MKLPQWLVVSLLSASVLAVLGAGVWWWVTWPERTARHFIELINTEDLAGARRKLTSESTPLTHSIRPLAADEAHRGEPWTIEPMPRSLWNTLIGRQEFKKPRRSRPRIIGLGENARAADGWHAIALFDLAGTLIVKRGSITLQWDFPQSHETAEIRLQRKQLIAERETGE